MSYLSLNFMLPGFRTLLTTNSASGIPARVVWGCVYTPEFDGSFGHHGWNEVYVGEAGWIPIDVTMHESDYLDSGHIRLGVLLTNSTLINYREMKILDYASR